MSDAELEGEMLRQEELAEIEGFLNRYPVVLRLLLHVDPETLARAAAAIQVLASSASPDARPNQGNSEG